MKNFTQMMKQAQELQGRMAEMQAEMERTIVEGRSGGGMVMVSLNGKGDMTGVKIDPSLLKPGEGEILEDLVVRRQIQGRGGDEGEDEGPHRRAAAPSRAQAVLMPPLYPGVVRIVMARFVPAIHVFRKERIAWRG